MTDTLIRGHLDQLLTNYAVAAAKNQSFIGDQVAPPVTVPNESDAYVKFGAEDLRLESAVYGGKGTVGRVEWTESLDQYLCLEYCLEAGISWQKMRNGDNALRLEQRAVIGLANKLKLTREAKIAAALFNATTFTATYAALAAADRWDADTSSPVSKVNDAKEAVRALIGLTPNTMVIGAHAWSHLRIHPDITQRVAGILPNTPATLAQAQAALDLDKILVGNAVYNTTTEGNTVTLGDVWGKYASICYIDPTTGGDAQGTIVPLQTFVCDAVAPPFSTFTYEENQTRKHIIQCYDCNDVKAIAVSSAYLYGTVVG